MVLHRHAPVGINRSASITCPSVPRVHLALGDSAARPGCCRKPPGARYIESGRERVPPLAFLSMHLVVRSLAEVIRTLGSEVLRKGGFSPPPPGDPVSIPHDVKNRGVGTGFDPEQNPQASGHLPSSAQVTESAWGNLSRWRHGFEPRWDYQGKHVVGAFVSALVKVQTRVFRPHQSPGQPSTAGWAARLSSRICPADDVTTSWRGVETEALCGLSHYLRT